MKHFYLLISLLFSLGILAEEIKYSNSWGEDGLTIESQNDELIRLNFSIKSFGILTRQINGEGMQELSLPGVFLPNNEGAPNLPGTSRYVAIPNDSEAKITILDYRVELIENIDIAPAPRIPLDTEDGPMEYAKNENIYNKNAFYPENPFALSEQTAIRGIDAVMLGITPFQYNPVTKQLKIYRNLKIEISFEGGSNYYGENRLRSRWWDPVLRDIFINESSIPEIDYNRPFQVSKETGCEYLIIVPNDPEFYSWADSIKQFRNLQGIDTEIVTLGEIGGNTTGLIENYINNAYNTWYIVPAAVLLLGDYGENADNRIISPFWESYCVSDNIYADVTGNSMPDIVFARITAHDEAELETIVTKFLNYEKNPPVNPDFYNHPVTALGWQTERWFQICSESIGGFWMNELGKDPVRINEVYDGNPYTDPWSTAQNTQAVVNVFGPEGLGYIPASPSELDGWVGGDANKVTDAINNGAFMLQHRDHGYEQGWGEPAYSSEHISDLINTDLTFIFSVNCLTGKYNLNGSCFAEVFHKHTFDGQNSGALGIIAASEVSYSFVNDTYVWGIYDNMWPEFLPEFGTTPEHRGVMPAFGNAAGKYFLQQSSWPYSNGAKEVTYNLFHHHGGAFLTVYTEMPQSLSVIHNEHLLAGIETFTVLADENSLIGLTIDGEIIATAEGTGAPVQISIPGQLTGSQMIVTVTKQNYYRYQAEVEVIDSNIPYIVQNYYELDDGAGNGNGLMDYGESISLDVSMQNIGLVETSNVIVMLETTSPYILITDGTELYGDFQPGDNVLIEDAFAFDVDNLIPDNINVYFDLIATDGNDIWTSQLLINSCAPVLELVDYIISDINGNNNGRIDPGETVDIIITIINTGSSEAFDVLGELICENPGITVNSSAQSYGNMAENVTSQQTFNITASIDITEGNLAEFDFNISGQGGINSVISFSIPIGRSMALIVDLDPENYSGPGIYETFENMDIYAKYITYFPESFDDYLNVFINLGLFSYYHELTQAEGQSLKDFLLEGGNLYLEGRRFWIADIPTPVHSMFNIDVSDAFYFEYENIVGVPGTLTNGMDFEFDSPQPANVYSLEPVSPAISILTSQDPYYSSAVAYDAGTYKTIGASFEFGCLTDGSSPSTKQELMQLILDWFQGLITGIDEPEKAISEKFNSIKAYPNPFSDRINISFSLNENSVVSVNIYNLQGEIIRTLTDNQTFVKGKHDLIWDGRNNKGNSLPAGAYFCTLQTGLAFETQKL
ncbi:MAG: T9SS type A sorting domain-containing protein, partial [Bacteroidales bacterium]|nr:T9SS type A sorting domain-containing protein [Bacteroidales bacterium]